MRIDLVARQVASLSLLSIAEPARYQPHYLNRSMRCWKSAIMSSLAHIEGDKKCLIGEMAGKIV
jgi:hypothetical protein